MWGWLFLLVLVAFGAAAVLAYYYGGEQFIKKPEKKPSFAPAVTAPETKPETRKVTVYLPRVEGKDVYLEPQEVDTESKGDMLDVSIDALIENGKDHGGNGQLIPDGTVRRTRTVVEDGYAVVDLSEEFVDNYSGGSDMEALTLNAIAHTVEKNAPENVKGVRILVEGKEVESLGGHFTLEQPVVADSTMLGPGKTD